MNASLFQETLEDVLGRTGGGPVETLPVHQTLAVWNLIEQSENGLPDGGAEDVFEKLAAAGPRFLVARLEAAMNPAEILARILEAEETEEPHDRERFLVLEKLDDELPHGSIPRGIRPAAPLERDPPVDQTEDRLESISDRGFQDRGIERWYREDDGRSYNWTVGRINRLLQDLPGFFCLWMGLAVAMLDIGFDPLVLIERLIAPRHLEDARRGGLLRGHLHPFSSSSPHGFGQTERRLDTE